MRVLVVYGTKYGHTGTVAERVAETLREAGHEVVVMDSAQVPEGFSVAGFDGFVLGGSLHYGRYRRSLRQFIAKYRTALAARPSAFFSVEIATLIPNPRAQAHPGNAVEQLQQKLWWRPKLIGSFWGAVSYTRYDPVTKAVFKEVSKRTGGLTDTTQDAVYTDWNAVAKFARKFAALLPTPPASAPEGSA